MSASPNLHYIPSGRIGWQAPFKVVVYGGIASAVLALIYAGLIRYNPFVYVSFIATAVFGAALGITTSLFADAGLSRSRAFNLLAGLTLGVWGLWVHWVAWAYLIYENGAEAAKALAASGPEGWLDFLEFTSQNIHHSFGRLGRSSAPASAGFMSWMWGIEAFVIVGLSTLSAAMTSGSKPFSEKARQWAVTDWAGEFSLGQPDAPDVENPQSILKRLDQDDGLEALAKLPLAPADPLWPTFNMKFMSAPNDPTCSVFSLSLIDRTTKADAKGHSKVSKRETQVVKNRYLEPARYARLIQQLASVGINRVE